MKKELTILSPTDSVRSATMRSVRSKDTQPELFVRRTLHQLGYRYRLHDKNLPGKPDIVFAGRKKVVFVNGCFWHGHDCRRGCRVPKVNRDYWVGKVGGNKRRDMQNSLTLQRQGWQVLIVWECETSKSQELLSRLIGFLEQPSGCG